MDDLFKICLVGIKTLVLSYIKKKTLASDWESNLLSPAYILRLFCDVRRTLVHTIERKRWSDF